MSYVWLEASEIDQVGNKLEISEERWIITWDVEWDIAR